MLTAIAMARRDGCTAVAPIGCGQAAAGRQSGGGSFDRAMAALLPPHVVVVTQPPGDPSETPW